MNGLKDKQAREYNEMLRFGLPEKIASFSSEELENYSIKYSLMPLSIMHPITEDGTTFYTVKILCEITNKKSGESISYPVNLINLPVLKELGFYVKNNFWQHLDLYARMPGWSFFCKTKKQGRVVEKNANLISTYGKSLNFLYEESQIPYVGLKSSTKDGTFNVSFSTFFRALSGLSDTELLTMFGTDNPFIIGMFNGTKRYLIEAKMGIEKPVTTSDCIDVVARALLGNTVYNALNSTAQKQAEIQRRLMNRRGFDLGDGNLKRFENTQSYQKRAVNKILNTTLTIDGKQYDRGIVLTKEILEKIDASDVVELPVLFNGKNYNLRKFSTFTFRGLGLYLAEDVDSLGYQKGEKLDLTKLAALNDTTLDKLLVSKFSDGSNPYYLARRTSASSLVLEDLYTAFKIFADNLNGFDSFDDEYELYNRQLLSFSHVFLTHVGKHMSSINDMIMTAIGSAGGDLCSLLDVISDYSEKVKLDSFIVEAFNNKNIQAQMTDMTNLLHLVSKDYKSTSSLTSTSAGTKAIEIQNTQLGRFDAFDQPESAKIGIVEEQTMMSQIDEAGNPTTPYYRICNGKKVSEEPVYLTAAEESGKCIAEWNETFVEEDGTQKAVVLARRDGSVLSVDMNLVTLQEYSPLQTLSPAHGLIPLANFENNKRTVMGSGQPKQALITLKPERPLLQTGVESILDAGCYRARDVLQQFYNKFSITDPFVDAHRQEILDSAIHLVRSTESISTRTRRLTFTVDWLEQQKEQNSFVKHSKAVLEVPFCQYTAEKNMFSYNVRPSEGDVYRGDDVVAYNIAVVPDDGKEPELCVDYGGYKPDPKIFKSGLALGKTLNVCFKCFESSSIDDAITISDRLIYDDTLTSITLFTCRFPLFSKGSVTKTLGGKLEHPIPHIGPDGLPIVGTYLKPDDPVVVMTTNDNGDEKVKVERLKLYEKGQVLASFKQVRNRREEVVVLLAARSEIEEGDKLAGRHGNKGVIARIVPMEQMPYDPETGTVMDICLNPLGVPSRGNTSQIYEVETSEAVYREGKFAVISLYHPDAVAFMENLIQRNSVKPTKLRDGRTGKFFDREIEWGKIYINKLVHRVDKKIHSIDMDAKVDPVFGQPKKGAKNDGGQAFGEMEAWCLESVGAYKTLNYINTVISDDAVSRAAFKQELSLDPENAKSCSNGSVTNGATAQSCMRALGIEIESDLVDKTISFRPLTDKVIRSFSTVPVDKDRLHDATIFGPLTSFEAKQQAKTRFSYLELNTKIVHPLWITKSKIRQLIYYYKYDRFKSDLEPCSISTDVLEGLLSSSLYLDTAKNGVLSILKPKKSKMNGFKNIPVIDFTEVKEENLLTGVDAVVWIFENYDLGVTEAILEDKLQKRVGDATKQVKARAEFLGEEPVYDLDELYASDVYKTIVKLQATLRDFNESGQLLKDYVVTVLPVLPQTFRVQMEGAEGNTIPDFDYHYQNILRKANEVKRNPTSGTKFALYQAIKLYTGLQSKKEKKSNSKKDSKYHNVLSYFCGKDRDSTKGKMRTAVQSKRVFSSGRSAIIPARYSTLKPTELGLPISMAVKMFNAPLIAFLRKELMVTHAVKDKWFKTLLNAVATDNLDSFSNIWRYKFADASAMENRWSTEQIFNEFSALITKFFEEGGEDGKGQVVLCGRQPSLHRYSIRAFYVRLVKGKAIQVNSLVCNGFNADFDGDTMWVLAMLDSEARAEVLRLLSPAHDFINPKDNSPVLRHVQDIVLGVYSATMLDENVLDYSDRTPEIHHYSSVPAIRSDIDAGMLKLYDVVCLATQGNRYLSTAGRILFNDLLPNGFGRGAYTNNLGLKDIKPELYRNLRCDGLVSNGKNLPKNGISLSKLVQKLHSEMGEACLDVYQAILEFGFKYNTMVGVSISTSDFKVCKHKEELERRGAEIKAQIETAYLNGLYSAEEKKAAIFSLYADKDHGILNQVEKDMIDGLKRNNNLFIMWDSGARGSKDQLMQACGMVGILQKTKQENMETPVTSSYFTGLTSFETHMASYSTRLGVSATQNETRNSGHATKQSVYMDNGFKIVAEDCGKTDWWFDVEWGDRIDTLDRFTPTRVWFEENLLGRRLYSLTGNTAELLGDTVKDGRITEESYEILKRGFINLTLEKDGKQDHVSGVPQMMIGHRVLKEDTETLKYVKNFLDQEGRLTDQAVQMIESKHLKEVKTDIGVFTFRYKLQESTRSLLMQREIRNAKHTLKKVWNNETYEIVTKDTLDWVEREGIDQVEARVLMDCECVGGVCSRCYGLLYTTMQFPEPGSFVGTESAQGTAEPSSQLVLDTINAGGKAGGSISGVETYKSFLGGALPGSSLGAEIAPVDGYVQLDRLDDYVSVSVIPTDRKCTMCKNCLFKNKVDRCPYEIMNEPMSFAQPNRGKGGSTEQVGSLDLNVLQGMVQRSLSLVTKSAETNYELGCTLPNRIYARSLIVTDGEFVHAGTKMTTDFVLPDQIKRVGPVNDRKHLMRAKQYLWFKNYYTMFCEDNSIKINARHFEVLTRLQNLLVTITDAEDKNMIGKTVDVMTVFNDPSIKFEMSLNKQADVVTHNGGGLTALSFEDVASLVADMAVRSFTATNDQIAPIARVNMGGDLVTNELPNLAFSVNTSDVDFGETDSNSEEDGTSVRPAFVPDFVSKEVKKQKSSDLFGSAWDDLMTSFDQVSNIKNVVTLEPKEATESASNKKEMSSFDVGEEELQMVSGDSVKVLRNLGFLEDDEEEEIRSEEDIEKELLGEIEGDKEDEDLEDEDLEEDSENLEDIDDDEYRDSIMDVF